MTRERSARKIGASGFEPLTSWSQARRASQTALRPVKLQYTELAFGVRRPSPLWFAETACRATTVPQAKNPKRRWTPHSKTTKAAMDAALQNNQSGDGRRTPKKTKAAMDAALQNH